MISKNYYWNLSIVFLTICAVYSHGDSFNKISLHDHSILETDIIQLPITQIRTVTPETSVVNTTQKNVENKNTSIQLVADKNNETKSQLNLSTTSVVTNDKVIMENRTYTVINEPPVHEGDNIPYNGTLQPVDLDFPSQITNETLRNHNLTKSKNTPRNRQDWFKKDCEKLKLNPDDICASEIPSLPPATVDNSSEETLVKPESHTNSSSSSTSLFFIALCVSLIIMSLAWTLYAYLNPHTRSGQLLIRYRPNQWGWRKGEARYTAATIHM